MTDEQTEQPEQQPTPVNLPVLLIGFMLVSVALAGAVLLTNNTAQQTAVPDTQPGLVQSGRNTVVGWQVPDFSLQTLDGDSVSLSDYRGKIVFLNFWATWCVPCQREMPAFEEFMASGRDDAVILAINNGENINDVRDFAALFDLEALPILLDSDFEIADGFGVMNLPVTYILDQEGIVHNMKLGEMTHEDIEAYIAALQS